MIGIPLFHKAPDMLSGIGVGAISNQLSHNDERLPFPSSSAVLASLRTDEGVGAVMA
jgi:hypothetical protein